MTYEEMIVKALRGRSVNQAAKDMGVAQKTFDRYVKGERLPDYITAGKLAREAGIPLGETMLILIREEEKRKEMKDILSPVFHRLTSALNRLYMRVYAA